MPTFPLSTGHTDGIGEVIHAATINDLASAANTTHAIQAGVSVTDPAYGAVGNGSTDDTTAINNAITAVNAAGGGYVYFPPSSGGYGVTCDSTPIDLLSNVTLVGCGYPGRIKRIGSYDHSVGRRLIRAATATNGVVNSGIINLYIDGQASGVTLGSTTLTVATTGGDATINVVSTASFPSSGKLKLASVPINYTGVTSTTFTGCTAAGAVPIPAASIGTTVLESIGNLSSQCVRWEPLSAGQHHDYIRFQNNVVADWPGASVHLNDVEHFIVSGNTITNSLRGGIIFFTDCHHGTVTGNDVAAGDDCIAVQANNNVATTQKGTGPAYFSIVGNTCESFAIGEQDTNNSMNLKGLVSSTIAGNTLIGAGESGGANKAALRISASDGAAPAALYGAARLNVSGNTLYSPKDHGIYLAADSTGSVGTNQDISIKNNLIIDPGQRGIYSGGYIQRLSITGNQIENANARNEGSMDSIYLTDAHEFVVSDNFCTNRGTFARFGVNIDSTCTNGRVFGNDCHDSQFTTRGFNCDSTSTLLQNNDPGATGSIATAGTVTLRDGYEFHTLSGTADVLSITAQPRETRVTLTFGATAAASGVVDGSNLKLAGNFVYTNNSTLSLVSDGTNWRETGRSLNG